VGFMARQFARNRGDQRDQTGEELKLKKLQGGGTLCQESTGGVRRQTLLTSEHKGGGGPSKGENGGKEGLVGANKKKKDQRTYTPGGRGVPILRGQPCLMRRDNPRGGGWEVERGVK